MVLIIIYHAQRVQYIEHWTRRPIKVFTKTQKHKNSELVHFFQHKLVGVPTFVQYFTSLV